MKGVTMPGVSAGSNHVGASEMWTPQVICPAGCVARAGSTEAFAASSRTLTAVAHQYWAMPGPVPSRMWWKFSEGYLRRVEVSGLSGEVNELGWPFCQGLPTIDLAHGDLPGSK